MRHDERASFDQALEAVRLSAYPPGEFVGQQSFMRASEILSLAAHAGVGPGASVLDLCCGVAGPGRLITKELGCAYLGVDQSPSAIAIARERSVGSDCRFAVAQVPPLPPGPFDVVLLLEVMLAFADKEPLLRGISQALPVGGRFAFTLEEGQPLSEAERRSMPEGDTVWLTPWRDIVACFDQVGLRVRWQTECSQSHHATVESLVAALAEEAPGVAAEARGPALDDLLAAHRLWGDWLRDGRVRKFAVVAERTALA